MNEVVNPVVAQALPTRSKLNPRAPLGARGFRPRDVAYVVEVGLPHRQQGTRQLVITSETWLTGWEVNKRVRVATTGRVLDAKVVGIMDFAAVVAEGRVPNVLLAHWRVENPKR